MKDMVENAAPAARREAAFSSDFRYLKKSLVVSLLPPALGLEPFLPVRKEASAATLLYP